MRKKKDDPKIVFLFCDFCSDTSLILVDHGAGGNEMVLRRIHLGIRQIGCRRLELVSLGLTFAVLTLLEDKVVHCDGPDTCHNGGNGTDNGIFLGQIQFRDGIRHGCSLPFMKVMYQKGRSPTDTS